MPTPLPQACKKPLSRGAWWICFILATYLMSLWFQTFKTFTLVPNWPNGLLWLGVMMILALVVGVLIYDSYVQEALRGNIQKPLRFFEWLMAKRFLLQKEQLKENSL